LRIEQQKVNKVLQVSALEVGQECQVLDPPGETEVGKLYEDLIILGNRAIVKQEAFFAHSQGQLTMIGEDRLKATQAFRGCSLESRVP
jgi:hypothetical protein